MEEVRNYLRNNNARDFAELLGRFDLTQAKILLVPTDDAYFAYKKYQNLSVFKQIVENHISNNSLQMMAPIYTARSNVMIGRNPDDFLQTINPVANTEFNGIKIVIISRVIISLDQLMMLKQMDNKMIAGNFVNIPYDVFTVMVDNGLRGKALVNFCQSNQLISAKYCTPVNRENIFIRLMKRQYNYDYVDDGGFDPMKTYINLEQRLQFKLMDGEGRLSDQTFLLVNENDEFSISFIEGFVGMDGGLYHVKMSYPFAMKLTHRALKIGASIVLWTSGTPVGIRLYANGKLFIKYWLSEDNPNVQGFDPNNFKSYEMTDVDDCKVADTDDFGTYVFVLTKGKLIKFKFNDAGFERTEIDSGVSNLLDHGDGICYFKNGTLVLLRLIYDRKSGHQYKEEILANNLPFTPVSIHVIYIPAAGNIFEHQIVAVTFLISANGEIFKMNNMSIGYKPPQTGTSEFYRINERFGPNNKLLKFVFNDGNTYLVDEHRNFYDFDFEQAWEVTSEEPAKYVYDVADVLALPFNLIPTAARFNADSYVEQTWDDDDDVRPMNYVDEPEEYSIQLVFVPN